MLKPGDRIRMLVDYESAKKGKEGTYLGICGPEASACFMGWATISFDEPVLGGHNCRGRVYNGHGLWIPIGRFMPLDTPPDSVQAYINRELHDV